METAHRPQGARRNGKLHQRGAFARVTELPSTPTYVFDRPFASPRRVRFSSKVDLLLPLILQTPSVPSSNTAWAHGYAAESGSPASWPFCMTAARDPARIAHLACAGWLTVRGFPEAGGARAPSCRYRQRSRAPVDAEGQSRRRRVRAYVALVPSGERFWHEPRTSSTGPPRLGATETRRAFGARSTTRAPARQVMAAAELGHVALFTSTKASQTI